MLKPPSETGVPGGPKGPPLISLDKGEILCPDDRATAADPRGNSTRRHRGHEPSTPRRYRREEATASKAATKMPCFHPIKAHQERPGAPLTFPKQNSSGNYNIKLPCSKCIGCRLERSKQIAVRLMHEAQLHESNSFITLTNNTQGLIKARGEFEDSPPLARPDSQRRRHYNERPQFNYETHLYEDSLSKRVAQLFMKRLRKELTTQNPSTKIKFYLVGEYGEQHQRPHYHAAIFGEDFARDRIRDRKSPSGEQLYRSPTLEKCWDYGYSSIGDLTFQSAAYIARYVMKKLTGPEEIQYMRETPDGETYWIQPEFALMSRGGRTGKGIANQWFYKYGTDTYPNDFVVMNGQQLKPPRYYDTLYALLDKEGSTLMKLERQFAAHHSKEDNTPRRLRVREQVAIARVNQFKRHL